MQTFGIFHICYVFLPFSLFTTWLNFRNFLDVLLMIIGTIGAVAYGLTQPLMFVIMSQSQLINTLGKSNASNITHEISKVCSWFSWFFRNITYAWSSMTLLCMYHLVVFCGNKVWIGLILNRDTVFAGKEALESW